MSALTCLPVRVTAFFITTYHTPRISRSQIINSNFISYLELWMRDARWDRRIEEGVFGSSKGSMVETLIYDSPLQEEPEASPPPRLHETVFPYMPPEDE
ncbi:hypothetical protein EVAR_71095_1 [Eumeta japonica]|uniref:Uncharacterized protein n=1 Tax=Eumeta variegata TaxID=151549 RepID=A0A4C1ST48_EUMVA|nr:hypothetical protein EVAR_71095_1 [Eumeta japonica]